LAIFTTLGILKLTLGNPLSRALLTRSTRRCPKCGDQRLRVALARYSGQGTKACLTCRMYSFAIGSLIDIGGWLLRTPRHKIKEYFKSQTTRRGLASIVGGIAEHGVTRPQLFGAPFLVVWDLTHACNLKCRHCLDYNTDLVVQRNGEIRIEKIGGLVDELIEENRDAIRKKDGFEILDLGKKAEIKVYSQADQKVELRPILKVMRKKIAEGELVEIKASGGIKLRVTKDHPILTQNGWEKVKDLRKDDCLTLPYQLTPPENVKKVNILKEAAHLRPERMRLRGIKKLIAKEANKKNLTVKELGKRVFPDIPDSTRDSWLYGYTDIPLSKAKRVVEIDKVNPNGIELTLIGSQGKSLPASFTLTPEFAEFLGYFISEGHFTKSTYRITISNENSEIINSFKSFCSSSGYSPVYEPHLNSSRSPQIYASSALLKFLLSEILRIPHYSREKRIPRYCFNAERGFIRRFLAAMFSGDGSIINPFDQNMHKYHSISYYSKSEKLIKGMSLLLWELGVPNYVRLGSHPRVEIPRAFYQEFSEKVGFSTKEKNEKLIYALGCDRKCHPCWIVNKKENKIYVRIDSIKEIAPTSGYVYDLTIGVEGGEEGNFLVGFPPVVVHNCYQRADRPLPDELTTEEGKRLINELADSNVVALAFSGGEPLMRPDFFELAAYARSLGMYVAIATNGTLITREVAKRLKEAVDYVEVSLDGATAKTHDEFRGIPRSFDRAVDGIKNCVKAGLYTCIATTATKLNQHEMQKTYELANKLGCKRQMIFNFVPTGRGIDMINLDLSPEEREELLEQSYANLVSGGGCAVLGTAPQLARVALKRAEETDGGPLVSAHFGTSTNLGEHTRLLAEFLGGCGAGRCYCAIEPNGDVKPCVFIPIKVGNIREKPFLEIWRDSPVLLDLRDRSKTKGHCSTCEYRYACGGCRARAYGYFGDYHMPDPGCINNVEYWNQLKQQNP